VAQPSVPMLRVPPSSNFVTTKRFLARLFVGGCRERPRCVFDDSLALMKTGGDQAKARSVTERSNPRRPARSSIRRSPNQSDVRYL